MSKTMYPFVKEDKQKQLRKLKKEELFAMVCFLFSKLGIAEETITNILDAGTSSDDEEEFSQKMNSVFRNLIENTVSVLETYRDVLPEDFKPGDSLYNMEYKLVRRDKDGCSGCPVEELCDDKECDTGRPMNPQYDPSDINVQ